MEDAVDYLKYIASQEGIEADEESLNLIAQKADGGMRDALSMFDKAVSFCGRTLDYRNVAQTLNVLDYDTYFSITEQLLAGDYVQALVSFDTVLSKGFSGQTFMAGLNRHMRDLLMAKRPETLRLIEMTGTLLERYRTQAGACDVGFLFGASALLTELDGKIRQSSNQRLLVELGLMKICGLGQKKNDGLTSGLCPLPELTPRTTPATATTPAAPVAPATPTPAATAPAAQPVAMPTPQPAALAPTQPVQQPARPAPVPQHEQPAATRPRRSLISGTSLTELLASAGDTPPQPVEEAVAEPQQVRIDPACAEKLENARGAILNLIRERRPRFVPVFERMMFRGNTLALSVPTTDLRDEILRSKTGMMMRIAEIAGVDGLIELDIRVDETIRAARPIRPEDKMKFITEQNPLVTELRKALDLEME